MHTGAPKHWRLRRQALAADAGNPAAAYDADGSYGAFAGLRVVFYGSSEAPSFASLSRMLKAGGGMVLRKAPPYTSCLPAPTTTTAAAGGGKKGAKGGGRKSRGSAVASPAAAAAGGSDSGSGEGFANLAVIGPDKASEDR